MSKIVSNLQKRKNIFTQENGNSGRFYTITENQ